MQNYIEPQFNIKTFSCPNCNALTQQNWTSEYYSPDISVWTGVFCAQCQVCRSISVWRDEVMILPKITTAPMPHPDMPDETRELYDEARLISGDSPRAAAALLRVALEKLTEYLGETEGKLNSRIGNLKAKGLPDKVIKSLDIVRVNGNEGGSHSGEIDLNGKDNSGVVEKLFWLVNYIVEKVITENNEIEEQFNRLPIDKIQGIENRDRAA